MPRTRNDIQHEATRAHILETARAQMALFGTAGIGLRAIARELGLTAPALYRYFPSLDDLITALIVENFTALAEALETARDQAVGGPVERLRAVMMAYRAWAVARATDFQLIYGNPIPGYHAPSEVTVPIVVRGFVVIVGLIEEALQSGALAPRLPYDHIPPATAAYLHEVIERDGYPVSAQALYLAIVSWTAGHGTIVLEMFHHLQPVIGDAAIFYAAQVERLLDSFGARPL
ncbi:MAG TPA: TetR/AcrR family transcriptional regulator [Candidatus Limnocylindrales bacterium]|nr:TetR/AcrR family transcriptional regulator [Candidatus Limnocylindrales bacterium]